MPDRPISAPTDRRVLPACSEHADSLVRRYRSHGPSGPGVYPQCVPRGGGAPHLLEWDALAVAAPRAFAAKLSPSECDVLQDAAEGLTTQESAERRFKSAETVKTQRRTLLAKLGARNMVQAVAIATRAGMLERRVA